VKRREEQAKRLPFQIDRSQKTPLTDQVVNGISEAIDRGRYADGAVLPSIRDLADETGISLISVRRAYARLAAAGRVVQVHGVGTIVRAGRGGMWRGHVLIVGYGHGENYLSNVIAGKVRERLYVDGWLVTSVQVPKEPKAPGDCLELGPVLRHSFDLILTLSDEPVVYDMLAGASSRVVALYHTNPPPAPFVGVRFDWDAALADMAADQAALGVRSVCEVTFNPQFATALPHFKSCGVRTERIVVRPGNARAVMREAVDKVCRRLAAKRPWPDLLYFSDDYMFVATVASLLKRAVDIPGKLRLASWINAGIDPVLPVPFAGVVFEPESVAARLFEIVRDILSGTAKSGSDYIVSTRYQREVEP